MEKILKKALFLLSSQERKEAVLKFLLPPHNMTVTEVAKQENIPANNLYNWRKKARQSGQDNPCQVKPKIPNSGQQKPS